MNKEEWIEHHVRQVEDFVYNGDMPVENKATLRRILSSDYDRMEFEARDYVYGQDEGGDPPQALSE